jgi:hypothetical protein
MDNQQFVSDAIRTEARIETVVCDRVALKRTLSALIALGSALDGVKKNAFYGKPIDRDTRDGQHALAALEVDRLRRHRHYERESLPEVDPRIFHAIVGKVTESIELLELLYAVIYEGQEFDRVNFAEELGDGFWYDAIGCDAAGLTFDEIQQKVIAKLKARYPQKFTSERAINRDLDTERSILER